MTQERQAEKIDRCRDQPPPDPGMGLKVLHDRYRGKSEPRARHRDSQAAQADTRNGWTKTTGVNMSAAAPSRMSALITQGGRRTNR